MQRPRHGEELRHAALRISACDASPRGKTYVVGQCFPKLAVNECSHSAWCLWRASMVLAGLLSVLCRFGRDTAGHPYLAYTSLSHFMSSRLGKQTHTCQKRRT